MNQNLDFSPSLACGDARRNGADGSNLAKPTPGLVLGPYYPACHPEEPSRSLWSADRALTQCDDDRMELQGRVIDCKGEPLAGAWVEVWHADAGGRYRHPSQPGFRGIDPRFQGYGATSTETNGAWSFTSVVPGSYGSGASARAPHVHFQVTCGDDRLVTQMFLPNHHFNAVDRWYQTLADPLRLVARTIGNGASLLLEWDIVMDVGGASR